MSNRGISIGILIFILLVIIVYAIVMLIMSSNRSGIFSPYNPADPPADQHAFYPLGTVTPMCQDEINQRNIIICNSYFGITGLTGASGYTGAAAVCNPDNFPQTTTPCPATPNLSSVSSNLNLDTLMFREMLRTR